MNQRHPCQGCCTNHQWSPDCCCRCHQSGKASYRDARQTGRDVGGRAQSRREAAGEYSRSAMARQPLAGAPHIGFTEPPLRHPDPEQRITGQASKRQQRQIAEKDSEKRRENRRGQTNAALGNECACARGGEILAGERGQGNEKELEHKNTVFRSCFWHGAPAW